MQILAIETSCDETAAAVIEDGQRVLSNVVATQIELHRRFGGVFPEVASRQHVLSIEPVIAQALAEAGINHPSELDAIAVTHGPGLAGSLLVGVNAAKGLAFASGLPLLPVNHLEGHVYSNWLDTGAVGPTASAGDRFPVLVLIVSGGHTELVLMTAHGRYERLGGTLDDAAGEAFDKVARLLDLGFPGGPAIERAAQGGNPARYPLPRGLRHAADHRYDFSFSGLKTAVLHLTQELSSRRRRYAGSAGIGRSGRFLSAGRGGCARRQDCRRCKSLCGSTGLHLRRRQRQCVPARHRRTALCRTEASPFLSHPLPTAPTTPP